ncbi:hypothetical protein SLEP1_g31200 [Rubroshorea leprosula]|uniref:Uncharacterized protein n=1 Tax=Rubroshorea leprosula TaxID=152421 RepID=A0AAV5K2P3_9ROSI|nr:hypothetical protein SLEP1_g31200 [Rubroshorea leprosula]
MDRSVPSTTASDAFPSTKMDRIILGLQNPLMVI